MNIHTQSELFQLNISTKAHIQAQNFCRYQSQTVKARQVYLNTLAVSVSSAYLNLIGWSASLKDSDSWNPALQTIMNTADLYLPSYGKLECRAVLSGENEVDIPPEVWSSRIGYLVIKLETSLQTANILGFLRQVQQQRVSLSQLESLNKFPAYLSEQKRLEPKITVGLSNWISGTLTHGWRQLDELFNPPMVVNFRSKELTRPPSSATSASRVKLVNIGRDSEHTIAIILNIQPLNEREFNISLVVRNYQSVSYLPEGLELVIIDKTGHPVMIAQANQTETIEFCFSGELSESFALEVSLAEQSLIEHFII